MQGAVTPAFAISLPGPIHGVVLRGHVQVERPATGTATPLTVECGVRVQLESGTYVTLPGTARASLLPQATPTTTQIQFGRVIYFGSGTFRPQLTCAKSDPAIEAKVTGGLLTALAPR